MLEPQKQQERVNRGYEIYALVDPRDNLIHYVGLSLSANLRFISHLNGNGGNKQEKCWIIELQREGLTPILQILETIEAGSNAYALACEEELYWIREMARQGHPLLNAIGITRSYVPAAPPYQTTKLKRVYAEEVVTSAKIDTSQAISADKTDTEELTVAQVAEELQVHKNLVYSWIQSGELPTIDLGRQGKHVYRISRADLDAFKQARKTTRDG